MELSTNITCPLGSECEKVSTTKENTVDRCAWYVEVAGVDAQGKEHNTSKCSMSWMPILNLEMAGTNRGQTKALESFRNEMVRGQEDFNNIMLDTNRTGVELNVISED